MAKRMKPAGAAPGVGHNSGDLYRANAVRLAAKAVTSAKARRKEVNDEIQAERSALEMDPDVRAKYLEDIDFCVAALDGQLNLFRDKSAAAAADFAPTDQAPWPAEAETDGEADGEAAPFPVTEAAETAGSDEPPPAIVGDDGAKVERSGADVAEDDVWSTWWATAADTGCPMRTGHGRRSVASSVWSGRLRGWFGASTAGGPSKWRASALAVGG